MVSSSTISMFKAEILDLKDLNILSDEIINENFKDVLEEREEIIKKTINTL